MLDDLEKLVTPAPKESSLFKALQQGTLADVQSALSNETPFSFAPVFAPYEGSPQNSTALQIAFRQSSLRNDTHELMTAAVFEAMISGPHRRDAAPLQQYLTAEGSRAAFRESERYAFFIRNALRVTFEEAGSPEKGAAPVFAPAIRERLAAGPAAAQA